MCLALLFISSMLAGNTQVLYNGWLGSVNDFKINNRFSVHFDAHLRSGDALKKVQTFVLRPGLNFKLSKAVTVSTGYAYFPGRRTIGSVSNLLPEHRIWQQAIFQHKAKKVAFNHRLRFEERWLSKAKVANNELETDGYGQAFRLRYLVKSIIPFTNNSFFDKGFFLALQNEFFFNTGNKTAVNGKSFDQNRGYAGIGYRLNNKVDVEAGYINQYTITTNSFINNHIAQIVIYKRL
jgi:hypothetical protein